MTVRVVDNLPVNESDCVFTTGATSVSFQVMGGGSDTVTCILDNIPAALFTDNGMNCVMYVHFTCCVVIGMYYVIKYL